MTQPRMIQIECLRYHPETDSEPHWQTFDVPFTDDMSVLQGLQHIKDTLDGSITFRWSCRMAICGSCGMMINGVPHLSCETFLRDFYPGPVRVEALENMPIQRDLAVDQSRFLKALQSITPYIVATQESTSPTPAVPAAPALATNQSPARMAAYYQYSQCINCLLCYAACPQVGLNENFAGPAALTLMHRYNNDPRDAGWAVRSELANSNDGVWGCTLVGYCSEVCPKGIDPAHAVNQNKIHSAFDYTGLKTLLEKK